MERLSREEIIRKDFMKRNPKCVKLIEEAKKSSSPFFKIALGTPTLVTSAPDILYTKAKLDLLESAKQNRVGRWK